MRNELDALLGKKMTRKQFLQHIGSVFLIAVGAGALLNVSLKPQQKASNGYGSNAYGGAPKHG